MIVRLALRNLWRHARRSLLTLGGVAAALALMMVTKALNEGAWAGVMAQAIEGSAGHVVVQAPGWQEERRSELAVPDSAAVALALRGAYPGTTVVRRTWIGGLLSSPRASAAVTLEGIEAEAEAALTLLDERMVEGTWLDDDDRGILLGKDLAATLGVGLGDKVVFMTQVAGGDMESRLFRVKGVFRTGNDMLDGLGAVARLEATQPLVGDVVDPAHQVAVVARSGGQTTLAVAPAEAALAGRAGIDVLTWREAIPQLEEQARLDASFNDYMFAIMGLIVTVGIANTVLMSVMERVREFGVLRALGLRGATVFRMILLEGLLLGVIGGLAGIALATPIVLALQHWGLDYGDMMAQAGPAAGVPFDSVLRARFRLGPMLGYAGGGVLAAVLASLWPAWKAARLRPIDAIHHV